MDKNLFEELKKEVTNEVYEDEQTLQKFSHDASIFEVNPRAVVFPKNTGDIKNLINFVNKHKKENPGLSLTGRAAGTDMSGGALSESIIVAFGKYFNHTPVLNGNISTTEPGVFYRDFETETLKRNLIFPSYTASKGICAMGGIFNNNSGLLGFKLKAFS